MQSSKYLCGKTHLINEYIDLLTKWNEVVGLVQHDSLNDVFGRHIEDSVQLCNFLSKDSLVLDIGSGAGLPGVILSVCGFERVVLCENNRKKIVFLQEVARKLQCKFEIFGDSIYNFNGEGYTAVSRGFGSLSVLLDVMLKISCVKGVFHKGETHMKEIEEAQVLFNFDYDVHLSETNSKSAIIIVQNIVRK